jgi:ankyrin repeat protein
MTNEVYWSIHDAVKEGRIEDLIALLDANPEAIDENRSFGTLLHVAASAGQIEIAKELVRKGVDVNERGGTFMGNALNEAATDGHYEMVKYLLEEGSEMDESDSVGNPLWGAILRDNVKIAQLLIDHGIDFNIKYGDMQMDAEAFAKEQGAGHCYHLLKELRETGKAGDAGK